MSTDVQRLYAVIGVAPDASDEAIRSAYRRRAKELHPDAQSGNAHAFITLKHAYDTLSDPDRRAAYDEACRAWQPPRATVRRGPTRPMPPPPPPRPIPPRKLGMGIIRYVLAFLVMAAISLGGVQAMISLTKAPPSIQVRTVAHPAAAPDKATEPAPAFGSTKSGFWDPNPPAEKAR
ncbi:MAG: J domain-containing protein [Acetobacteraceae bacterium]|nr:J domain-containing protein [Acetobacteraceae bacterium]